MRAFVSVAQEGNLTRAAERLYVTQPALSLQLKKLQAALGMPLFERTSRGMRLTDVGQRLLPAAEGVLASAGEFEAAAAALRGQVRGRLKMGTILDPEFLRLGAYLGLLSARHPGVAFDLSHGMSGAVASRIATGELDVGYTLDLPGSEQLHARFHVEPLTRFTYQVVAPSSWAAQIKGKSWAQLSVLPWVGTPTESIHHKLLSHCMGAAHKEMNVVARVDLEPSMLDLVRSGVALSLARDSIALRAYHAGGIAIADGIGVQAELSFVCRKDRQEAPLVQAAMAVMRSLWRE